MGRRAKDLVSKYHNQMTIAACCATADAVRQDSGFYGGNKIPTGRKQLRRYIHKWVAAPFSFRCLQQSTEVFDEIEEIQNCKENLED